MRTLPNRTIRNINFAAFAVLLVLFTVITFMTYAASPGSLSYNKFAVGHHAEIMAGLVIVAVVFGFVLSQSFYTEIRKKREESQTILSIVLQFLNHEERAIINLLVKSQGSTSQAEIARLPHMSRVKAHRSLQKMQEKQLIEIVAHGKVRRVHLKDSILELLSDQKSS